MSPTEQNQTVSAGDEVVFKWSGVSNVYRLPSKAAFDLCDFSEAIELASHSLTTYTYKATTEGKFFFACKIPGRCEMAQKMSLTVTSGMFLRNRSIRYTLRLYIGVVSVYAEVTYLGRSVSLCIHETQQLSLSLVATRLLSLCLLFCVYACLA